MSRHHFSPVAGNLFIPPGDHADSGAVHESGIGKVEYDMQNLSAQEIVVRPFPDFLRLVMVHLFRHGNGQPAILYHKHFLHPSFLPLSQIYGYPSIHKKENIVILCPLLYALCQICRFILYALPFFGSLRIISVIGAGRSIIPAI